MSMHFLVISQRTPGNPLFNLKDLTGHGRIDILVRCILSASRPLFNQGNIPITVFFKGSETHGWITWDSIITDEDEISFAAKLQGNWGKYYTEGSLELFLTNYKDKRIILLTEDGINYSDITSLNDEIKNTLVILGAQQDLRQDDLSYIGKTTIRMNLGDQSLLASQSITFLRQLSLIDQNRETIS